MLFSPGMQTVVRSWHLSPFRIFLQAFILLSFLLKDLFHSVLLSRPPFFHFYLLLTVWILSCHVTGCCVAAKFFILGVCVYYAWHILRVRKQHICKLCPGNVAFMCICACWLTFHMCDGTCVHSHSHGWNHNASPCSSLLASLVFKWGALTLAAMSALTVINPPQLECSVTSITRKNASICANRPEHVNWHMIYIVNKHE